MSRPCKPVKCTEKCLQNASEKLPSQSEESAVEENEAKLDEKVAENGIDTHSSIEKVVDDVTSDVIKSESRLNVNGSEENRLKPDEKEISIYSPFIAAEPVDESLSNASIETVHSELKDSFKSDVVKSKESLKSSLVEGSFSDLKSKSKTSIESSSKKSTGYQENLDLEARAARKHSDDLDYIKKAVGPAVKKALAAVVVHQPADPVNYFANFLFNYRYNQRMFEKREQDLKNFLELRENFKKKEEN